MDSTAQTDVAPLIDCRGLQCPAPILKLSEVARKHPGAGGTLTVLATDPDFPVDLEAWCRKTKSTLVRLEQEQDGVIRAHVRLGAAPNAAPATMTLVARGASANGAPPDRDSSPSGSRINVAAIAVPTPAIATPAPPIITPAPPIVALAPAPAPPITAPAQDARISASVSPRENRATLLVLHNDLEALLSAMMVANASAAQGMQVEIYFAFWGIHLLRGERPRPSAPRDKPGLLQRILLWLVPKGPSRQRLGRLHVGGLGTRILLALMRKRSILALGELVDAATEQGVKFRVCSMSMGLMGLSERDIVDLPNVDFAGMTSFAESASRSSVSLVF